MVLNFSTDIGNVHNSDKYVRMIKMLFQLIFADGL
jgi:hypothetical protein